MNRYKLSILVLSILFAAGIIIQITFGPAALSVARILACITAPKSDPAGFVILTTIRIPRIIAAIISGIGLSVSGTILQTVFSNSLAAPNIIGVNAGAGLSTILAIVFFPTAFYLLSFAAFVGGLITTMLILIVSKWIGRSGRSIILIGVILSSLFTSIISMISSIDTDIMTIYSSFTIGSFSGVSLKTLAIPACLVAVSFIVSIIISRPVSSLSLGDDIASGIGIRVQAMRGIALVISSVCASAVVSFAGLLGFVGLMVPNFARDFAAGNIRRQLIIGALLGSDLLLFTDFFGRTFFTPSEVPVGVLTALIGAPAFFLIFFKRSGKYA